MIGTIRGSAMVSKGRRAAVAVGVPLAALALVLGPGWVGGDASQEGAVPTAQEPVPAPVPSTRAAAPGAAEPGTSEPDGTPPGVPAPGTTAPGDGGRRPADVPPKVEPTFVAENGGLWSTEIPVDGGGRLRTVAGSVPAPHEAARILSVRVEIEEGLGIDGAVFADAVLATLNDPRGWGHDGSVAFARTDGEADIDVTLASPATTDRLCYPVDTQGRVSCGRVGFAVLNARNWAVGAEPFLAGGGTVAQYREYLVNHEVGHVLGHPHESCQVPGEPAPIMLQQTLRLEGCQPNPWPGL
ncbi:DUF3152 domain-containing protein [Georgenia wangjunii]|uniref:DUF3152 domain-containing protein n=1 Tax=Georgenia wangjunii TaxID=3117730 RepID=UPI002F265C4A